MPRNRVPAAAPGLPAARLDEIHDCIPLALDATERPSGYSQPITDGRLQTMLTT